MGELILCRGTLAAVPYFLESIAVNIYSLEELAWCMDQHTELTGIDIYKESFAGWVKEELGLADEGQTLFDLLASILIFLALAAIGYTISGFSAMLWLNKTMFPVCALANTFPLHI